MDRRQFLGCGLGAAVHCEGVGHLRDGARPSTARFATTTEVIGDGSWVWTSPPLDDKGYVEPRRFDLVTQIRIRASGPTGGLLATTMVPVELPEQRVEDFDVSSEGCVARLRPLGSTAGQLVLFAATLRPGQIIAAQARFRLTLLKQFFHFNKQQFPAAQEVPKEIRQQYSRDTVGIQTRPRLVRQLAEEVAGQLDHPWDKAHAFKKWILEHIHAESALRYRGVVTAIRTGVGDCEERSAVFAALCRVAGIPARIVWVPNHVWAEFWLRDHENRPYWIPAHTSGYTWFGLTGAHELVMQKGEGIRVPEKRSRVRFIHEWAKWTGPKPQIQYTSQLTPLADGPHSDPGPGSRIKPPQGAWQVGNHPLDKFLLNGQQADESPFKKNKKEVMPWE